VFAPASLQDTIDQVAAAQDTATDTALAEAARAKIDDANRKLTRYRAVIDAGGDLQEIGTWISEAKAERVRAEADLRMLHDADQAAKAKVYRKAGVKLTYLPVEQLARVAARPNRTNIGKWYVSEERHSRKTTDLRHAHHRADRSTTLLDANIETWPCAASIVNLSIRLDPAMHS
jgi:hypothetical protein